ncbi:MAG: hypothetical protein R2729_19355 [Bryobacteraceae bacterium]
MNVWTYNSTDFGSANVPFCPDGTSAMGVLPNQIAWDRTFGFTDLEDLVARLDTAFPAPAAGADASEITTLGILAHGQPDGIAVLRGGRVLNSGQYGANGGRLTELNAILHRGSRRRPLVILYACASAARHRDTPAGTDGLLEWMSNWLENTRVVGFTHLLTLDGLRTQDLPTGGICLAPDVFETTEEYEYGRDIRAQGVADATGARLPVAGPSSTSAVEYLNGRRVTSSTESGSGDRRRRGGRPRRGSGPA